METNRTSKWKGKREQIAKEKEAHKNVDKKLKEIEITNFLTENQRDLIALYLAVSTMQERYMSMSYYERLNFLVKTFATFREDVEEKDKELNANEQTIL